MEAGNKHSRLVAAAFTTTLSESTRLGPLPPASCVDDFAPRTNFATAVREEGIVPLILRIHEKRIKYSVLDSFGK